MGKLTNGRRPDNKNKSAKGVETVDQTKYPESKSKKIRKFKQTASQGMEIEEENTSKVKLPKYTSSITRASLSKKPKADMFKAFKSKFEEHKKLFVDGKKLSKGQKRRLEGKERFLKQKYFREFLKKQEDEGVSSTINLKEFEGALDFVDLQIAESQKKVAAPVLSEKRKQELERKEVARCNQIIQHPQFKANPFQTLKLHLTNTLAQKK